MGHTRWMGASHIPKSSISACFNNCLYRSILLHGSRGGLIHPFIFKDNSVSGHSGLDKYAGTSLLCLLFILTIVRPFSKIVAMKNKDRTALLVLVASKL